MWPVPTREQVVLYRLTSAAIALFLMATSACTAADSQPSTSSSPLPEKVTIALQAKVKLDPPLTWTPTHFAQVLIENQSVSQVEKWPLDGDEVDVICRDDNGGQVLDTTTNTLVTVWYRIRVPEAMVDPQVLDATGPKAREIEGGYNAFIEGFYLQIPQGKEVPTC